VRDDQLGVAESMYDPDLVRAGSAEPAEIELALRTVAAIEQRFGATPLIARVDMLDGPQGSPVLLELEAIEPNLYFDQAPAAAERLADQIITRASGPRGAVAAGRPAPRRQSRARRRRP
jgi:hypothetical protein